MVGQSHALQRRAQDLISWSRQTRWGRSWQQQLLAPAHTPSCRLVPTPLPGQTMSAHGRIYACPAIAASVTLAPLPACTPAIPYTPPHLSAIPYTPLHLSAIPCTPLPLSASPCHLISQPSPTPHPTPPHLTPGTQGGRDLDGAAIRVNTARGTPYPVGGGRGRGGRWALVGVAFGPHTVPRWGVEGTGWLISQPRGQVGRDSAWSQAPPLQCRPLPASPHGYRSAAFDMNVPNAGRAAARPDLCGVCSTQPAAL